MEKKRFDAIFICYRQEKREKRGEKGPKKEKKKFFHFPLDFFGNIRYNNQAPYGEVF